MFFLLLLDRRPILSLCWRLLYSPSMIILTPINRRLSSRVRHTSLIILLFFVIPLLWSFWIFKLHTPNALPQTACVWECWVNLGERPTISICTVVEPSSLSRQWSFRGSVNSVISPAIDYIIFPTKYAQISYSNSTFLHLINIFLCYSNSINIFR